MTVDYNNFYKGGFCYLGMADDPPDDGDESGFRLPSIGLGKCMVPRNGDSSSGCRECARTHYDEFARISEDGCEYILNDCARHYTTGGWKSVADVLRTRVNHMQAGEERLGAYEVWVLRRMENLLSAYDTAHTVRDPFDQSLETFLASQQVETPV